MTKNRHKRFSRKATLAMMIKNEVMPPLEHLDNQSKLFDQEPYIFDEYTKTVTVELDCSHYFEMIEMFVRKAKGGGRGPWYLTAENPEKTLKIEFETGLKHGNMTRCAECGLVASDDFSPFNCEKNTQTHLDFILHSVFKREVILTLWGVYMGHW